LPRTATRESKFVEAERATPSPTLKAIRLPAPASVPPTRAPCVEPPTWTPAETFGTGPSPAAFEPM
jgi:hypothetical protein